MRINIEVQGPLASDQRPNPDPPQAVTQRRTQLRVSQFAQGALNRLETISRLAHPQQSGAQGVAQLPRARGIQHWQKDQVNQLVPG